MSNFKVHFLGTGSAVPDYNNHSASSQVVEYNGKMYMVDCGECAQYKAKQINLSLNRIEAVFISHVHGDHTFGLIGMIASMAMSISRTKKLTIFSPPGVKDFVQPQIDLFCGKMTYPVEFVELDPFVQNTIQLTPEFEVIAFPMYHSVDSVGYLFREVNKKPHINPDAFNQYGAPFTFANAIKNGEDYMASDGTVIKNHLLTIPPTPCRSYAYCSDTARLGVEQADLLMNVDAMYHETSFKIIDKDNALRFGHSTTQDAGEFATECNCKKLYIGHMSARYPKEEELLEETRQYFKNTEIAKELETIEID